jgi:hypothetical protein
MFKAQRQFDDQSAKMLDSVADRVDGKPSQESDLILVYWSPLNYGTATYLDW